MDIIKCQNNLILSQLSQYYYDDLTFTEKEINSSKDLKFLWEYLLNINSKYFNIPFLTLKDLSNDKVRSIQLLKDSGYINSDSAIFSTISEYLLEKICDESDSRSLQSLACTNSRFSNYISNYWYTKCQSKVGTMSKEKFDSYPGNNKIKYMYCTTLNGIETYPEMSKYFTFEYMMKISIKTDNINTFKYRLNSLCIGKYGCKLNKIDLILYSVDIIEDDLDITNMYYSAGKYKSKLIIKYLNKNLPYENLINNSNFLSGKIHRFVKGNDKVKFDNLIMKTIEEFIPNFSDKSHDWKDCLTCSVDLINHSIEEIIEELNDYLGLTDVLYLAAELGYFNFIDEIVVQYLDIEWADIYLYALKKNTTNPNKTLEFLSTVLKHNPNMKEYIMEEYLKQGVKPEDCIKIKEMLNL